MSDSKEFPVRGMVRKIVHHAMHEQPDIPAGSCIPGVNDQEPTMFVQPYGRSANILGRST